MPALLDLAGKKFGEWQVLDRAPKNDKGAAMWNCLCRCGTARAVLGSSLKSQLSRSCGKCGDGIALLPSERKALNRQNKSEEAAKKVLDDPQSTLGQRERADRVIRLAQKHRTKLEEDIAKRKQSALLEKNQEQNETVLEKLQRKYPEGPIPAGEARVELLKHLQAELPALTAPAFASLRFYVLGRIAELEDAIRQEQALLRAQAAEVEKAQVELNQTVCADAEARIRGRIDPLLQKPMTPQIRKALQNYVKTMITNSRSYVRELEKEAQENSLDNNGARKTVVARYILRVFEEYRNRLKVFAFNPNVDASSTSKWMNEEWSSSALLPEHFAFRTLEEKCHIAYALRLYYRNNGMAAELASVPKYPEPIWPPEAPHQSLEGVIATAHLPLESSWHREEQVKQQQEDLEKLRVTDTKAYKELLKKGPDILETWSRMNSEERRELQKTNWKKARTYEQVAHLLKSISTDVPTVIYRVPVSTIEQPNLPDVLYWPYGEPVQIGVEIIRDPKLGFVLAPEPASAHPEYGKGTRKMESYQDEMDGGKWKKRPVDEDAAYEQGLDGHWRQTGGSSTKRWANPVRIVFKIGKRPSSPEHIHFRHGEWFTTADVQRAETGWTDKPPRLLPDLKPTIADSITTVPASKEDRWEIEKTRQWGPA